MSSKLAKAANIAGVLTFLAGGVGLGYGFMEKNYADKFIEDFRHVDTQIQIKEEALTKYEEKMDRGVVLTVKENRHYLSLQKQLDKLNAKRDKLLGLPES